MVGVVNGGPDDAERDVRSLGAALMEATNRGDYSTVPALFVEDGWWSPPA